MIITDINDLGLCKCLSWHGRHGEPHMHLWGAASQQVDQSRVERHDGVAHVNDFSSFLASTATQGKDLPT